MPAEYLSHTELAAIWPHLTEEERREGFALLSAAEAEELFRALEARDQAELLTSLPESDRRIWIRLLPPDETADLIQEVSPEERDLMLALLEPVTQREVSALLAYAEDQAGGLMNPRYARLRPEMSADEAISYLRRQTRAQIESIYYAYVLDADQRLIGVVSFRDLLMAGSHKRVRDFMRADVVTLRDDLDQEAVGRTLAQTNLLALPVVDSEGRMKGIVTADDVVDVVQEEATEDIQKIGGVEALEAPYLQVSVATLLRKRGFWLGILFVGEMLTVSVMAHFEHQIARVAVLMTFIPLIISAGGNAGSQAGTLVIRAMALGEVKLSDFSRVFRRELIAGSALGAMLGTLGLLRVLFWEGAFRTVRGVSIYGEHFLRVGLVVAASVMGVVLWGALVGGLLPFLLRRFNLDPATASAPFVATCVDVTGILIYFTVAQTLLGDIMF